MGKTLKERARRIFPPLVLDPVPSLRPRQSGPTCGERSPSTSLRTSRTTKIGKIKIAGLSAFVIHYSARTVLFIQNHKPAFEAPGDFPADFYRVRRQRDVKIKY